MSINKALFAAILVLALPIYIITVFLVKPISSIKQAKRSYNFVVRGIDE